LVAELISLPRDLRAEGARQGLEALREELGVEQGAEVTEGS
jgi:hypothetical protein